MKSSALSNEGGFFGSVTRWNGQRSHIIQTSRPVMEDTAVLSSFKNYTKFSFGGKTLTFRTCDGLERYVKVLTWDNGYLEVLAKYKQREKEIEEYIDLEPVLNRLYMDKAAFLGPIKKVRIEYV